MRSTVYLVLLVQLTTTWAGHTQAASFTLNRYIRSDYAYMLVLTLGLVDLTGFRIHWMMLTGSKKHLLRGSRPTWRQSPTRTDARFRMLLSDKSGMDKSLVTAHTNS